MFSCNVFEQQGLSGTKIHNMGYDKPLKGKFQTFKNETSGNFSIMMASVLAVLLAGVGFAVDTSGATQEQKSLQANFDAAALSLAISGLEDADEIKAHAVDYLAANQAVYNGSDLDITRSENGEYRVAGTGPYQTQFGKFLGKGIMDVYAESIALSGASSSTAESTEIVMVLDTTESMEEDDKIISLRIAANDLISSLDPVSDVVKLGIVPFANYINVGTHNRGASWLEVPPDRTESSTYEPKIYNSDAHCRSNPRGTDPEIRDGVPQNRSSNACPASDWVDNSYTTGEPVATTVTYTWQGCVRPRNRGGLDPHPSLTDEGFDALKVQGHDNMECSDPIVPLTHNYTTISTAINTLNVDKDTYMPGGIVWG